MQPRTERSIPINSSTEVHLSTADTGTFDIDSVTSTSVIVLGTNNDTPSAVNDFYNGLRFRKEEIVPAGQYTLAQRRSSGAYLATDYVGASKSLTFSPTNTAAGDFVAGMKIVIGPSLPAAFSEMNIGGGSAAFYIAEVASGTGRTDYIKIGAGLFRTYTVWDRGKIGDLYILSTTANDTIFVEYK